MTIKSALLSVPIVDAVAQRLRTARFAESGTYWENRYRRGGTSGAGSYGRLAEFKAEVLNAFVAEHGVTSVLELGCGDGAQLQHAVYPRYTGVDISRTSIEQCRRLFAHDRSKVFAQTSELSEIEPHELVLSLDVIYHLVEDSVFEGYMVDLFRLASRYVIVYASNVDRPHSSPHVRHRRFTDWIERNAPDWRLMGSLPNRYPADVGEETDHTSFSDFYIFTRTV